MGNVLFLTFPMRPDGALFAPVGARVGFELPKAGVDPDTDARRQPFARAVHFPDLGGMPVREAAGRGAVLSGLHALHAGDDQPRRVAGASPDAPWAGPGARR